MSRSGCIDGEIRSKRGQAFLREMLAEERFVRMRAWVVEQIREGW